MKYSFDNIPANGTEVAFVAIYGFPINVSVIKETFDYNAAYHWLMLKAGLVFDNKNESIVEAIQEMTGIGQTLDDAIGLPWTPSLWKDDTIEALNTLTRTQQTKNQS